MITGRVKSIITVITMILTLTSCGGERVAESGGHFQNQDCLKCHNRDLGEEAHLTYGGTVYLDSGSDPKNFARMCKEQIYLQLTDVGNVFFDSRDFVSTNDSGALGRSNIYLQAKVGAIPVGDYTMRLILENGTLLAKSAFPHRFEGAFNVSDTADAVNRYSCNGCHSIDPKQGALGLMVVDQNLAFCLNDPKDVPLTTFFASDTYPLLSNQCGACHHDGGTGTAFDFFSNDIPGSRIYLASVVIDKVAPSNSSIFSCPQDSNHSSLAICGKSGTDYERVIDWIKLEAENSL